MLLIISHALIGKLIDDSSLFNLIKNNTAFMFLLYLQVLGFSLYIFIMYVPYLKHAPILRHCRRWNVNLCCAKKMHFIFHFTRLSRMNLTLCEVMKIY